MIDLIILNYLDEIIGGVILIFGLIMSIVLMFYKTLDNYEKIIGLIFVTGLVLFSNNQYTYLLGLIVIGTLITGTEFMKELLKWMKTNRTEKYIEQIQISKESSLKNKKII